MELIPVVITAIPTPQWLRTTIFVSVSQEFGKGSLHHQMAPMGWLPNVVHPHGRQLTVAVSWEFHWSCQAEHLPAASPAWQCQGNQTSYVALASRAEVSGRLGESDHGLFWPRLGHLGNHKASLPCIVLAQVVTSPPRCRPHLSMGRVSESLGVMFYNCHNGSVSLCVLCHSLQIAESMPMNLSTHRLCT